MNQEPNEKRGNPTPPPRLRRPNIIVYFLVIAAIVGIWIFSSNLFNKSTTDELNSSQFHDYFMNEQVESMYSKPVDDNFGHYEITGTYITASGARKNYVVILLESELETYIYLINNEGFDAVTTYKTGTIETYTFWSIVASLIPYLLITFLVVEEVLVVD